ncbi:MAG TPA: protein kinase [Pirellulales bacterium]|nr:protein kinase [Pirellulales bacterium]
MNRDRDILFGIVAGERGYLSRQELLAAVNDWREHQHERFGNFLVATGRLTVEQREAVERLVEGDVHGDGTRGNATTSIRAGLEAQIRAALAGGLGATVAPPAATLAADEAAQAASPEVRSAVGSEAARRFRILRQHALGGLGEIFVAHDQELNRQVALKRIRGDDVDTPANRARFMVEAEVTGGLEHPCIVPVYSLGTSDDGRPFYVMRFIHGESLREAIKAFHAGDGGKASLRSLALRQLLTRFIEVCNAIEYAHSREVLHRDVKPENIMLGTYGETVVVDWGLAKTLHAPASENVPPDASPPVDLPPSPSSAMGNKTGANNGSTLTTDGDRSPRSPGQDPPTSAAPQPSTRHATTPTQFGSALGTPGYMSPEQAAGRLDEVGPATDVYGLGSTLYCLLTGKPAFDDPNLARVLEQVRQGRFSRPREVNHQVPLALEAICLKAMAVRPADRYPSPRALATDIERWLADERVSVYRPPWHERLWRWGRRHRRGVSAAGAVLAIVTVVSTSAALVVQSAKMQVEDERDTAKLALQAEQRAERAARQALTAERAAKEDARRTIDNYVSLVTGDEMLKEERAQPLRQRLLRDALTYYEDLIQKYGDEELVRRDLAGAILHVGRINQETGSKQDALRAFEHGADILKQLVDRYPEEDSYRADLAFAHRNVGILQGELSRPEEALNRLRDAVQVQEVLVRRSADVVAYRRELATCYARLADQEEDLRRDDDALAHAEQALGIRTELKQKSPDEADLAADLAASRQSLAIFHAKRERWPLARENFEEALRIRSDLSRRHGDVDRYQVDLAATWNGLGALDTQTNQLDRGESEFLESLGVRERLAEDHPTVTEYQQMLAVTCKNLGLLKGKLKQWPESLDYMQRSLATWRRLVKGNPAVDRYQIHLGDTWYDVGSVQLELNRPTDALESFCQARDSKQSLADAKPDSPRYRSALGAAYENVASTLHLLARNDEARSAYQQAIEAQRQALETTPDELHYRRLLAHHYLGLAEVERALDHPEAAQAAEAHAAAINPRGEDE